MTDDAKRTLLFCAIVIGICTLGLIIATLVDIIKGKDPKPEIIHIEYTCENCGYKGVYNGIKGFETCMKCGKTLVVPTDIVTVEE